MITTAVYNGIEFRIQPNGAVEIFADRPSVCLLYTSDAADE